VPRTSELCPYYAVNAISMTVLTLFAKYRRQRNMLSWDQKVRIIELWNESKSCVTVRRKFIIEYGLNGREKYSAPSNKIIGELVQHFQQYGSVHPQRKGKSGNKRTVRTPEKLAEVRQSVARSPCKSLSRRALTLGISKQMTHKCLKDDLKLFPYRITVHHLLGQDDISRRLQMCQWFHKQMEDHPDWIENVWFSDEAHFHLNGAVNNHNNVFWGNEKPDMVAPKSLKGPKVTAWCALNSKYGMMGPYWFEEDGQTVTVNQVRYRTVIDHFFQDLKSTVTTRDLPKVVFMQDGAPPHTANETIEHLYSKFGDCYNVIGVKLDIEWAPHSPDLNPLDFFFWGAAKAEIYKNSPRTLADLKESVSAFTRGVSVALCKRVIENFAVRINACANRQGRHIEHVNYHSCA